MTLMKPTLVLNVVGLTPSLIGQHSPALKAFRDANALRPLRTILPAVTCSVQSSMVTGTLPSQHGIVGNGWYFRELAPAPVFALWSRAGVTAAVKNRGALGFKLTDMLDE